MQNEKDVIPAGSGVPTIDVGETEATAQETQEQPKDTGNKASEDMASLKEQLANAQNLIGRQGQELGELRQSYQALSDSQQQAAEASGDDDYEAKILDIREKVDNGEIDFGEAFALSTKLSVEMGARKASDTIKTELQRSESQKIQEKFFKEHPDFVELRDSGALSDIMRENPMHDEFSAYHEAKRVEMVKKFEEAVANAKAEGEQAGAQMAEQKKKASGVLGKQGSGVRDTNQPKSFKNAAERRQAMIDAVKGARSAE